MLNPNITKKLASPDQDPLAGGKERVAQLLAELGLSAPLTRDRGEITPTPVDRVQNGL